MDDRKLTTEELYGKSEAPQSPAKPLVYEETPIIEPVKEPSPVMPPGSSPSQFPHLPSSSPPLKRNSPSGLLGTVGTILLFIILFGAGVWLSTVLRDFLPSRLPSTNQPTALLSPASTFGIVPTASTDSYAAWSTYDITSGTTKQSIPGISYKLPSDVLSPICDGANCASQGTYLPGGTRFTIAARGGRELLRDFRGAVITDAGGREFTTTPTTIAEKHALEFRGLFTGTTSGGYSFSQMRGVMIEVDSTLSLEINHFTPTGVSADFASDDGVFDEILKTLVLASVWQ